MWEQMTCLWLQLWKSAFGNVWYPIACGKGVGRHRPCAYQTYIHTYWYILSVYSWYWLYMHDKWDDYMTNKTSKQNKKRNLINIWEQRQSKWRSWRTVNRKQRTVNRKQRTVNRKQRSVKEKMTFIWNRYAICLRNKQINVAGLKALYGNTLWEL